MEERTTDVLIIGAGSAGLNARREAERSGASWLLVESGPYGTTCARVGCMPSKLLIAAADATHEARHAARFGVHSGEVRVDGREVMARVRSERDRFVGFVVRATEAHPAEQRLRGHATFLDPNTVQVGDHTVVRAKAVVVATGSAPWVPPGYEAVADRILKNDDVFDWDDLPESVAVVGTGIIGMELGQALHRLGVRVGFFNVIDQVSPFSDPVMQQEARDLFAQELNLNLAVTDLKAEPHGETGVRLTWRDADGVDYEATYQHLLMTTGRRPRVEGLGLDKLGVPLGRFGLPSIDEYTGQAENLPVFFAGDVTGERPLLHEASDEGRIAGANAATFPEVVSHSRRTPLAIAFTDPQMAVVGLSWQASPKACTSVGEVSYDDQGRARVMGKNQGRVRIYADRRTRKITGAEMMGPRVEHTAHLLAWAIADGLSVEDALGRPFYHPVVEEGIRTALRDLAESLRVMPHCGPQAHADGPGE